MLLNLLIILILVGLAVLFWWLVRRAWGSRWAWLKYPGIVLSGLLALLFTAVSGVVLLGFFKMNVAPAAYSVSPVKVAMTPEQISRGQRYASICLDCHSSSGQFPLDGSKADLLAGGPPLGAIYAPNLTPGGPLKDWSDGEILRAMREGIGKDGRPLIVMPSMAMHNMSDTDAQAVVAFLRSQPAVKRDLPERDLNAVAAAFLGIGLFPTSAQTPITQPIVAPATGTPEYGRYLTRALGCTDCHGQNYTGVSGGFGPSGPNLTVLVPKWSLADFTGVIRKGRDPSGRPISDTMPYVSYNAALTDAELADIYSYLHSLSPAPSVTP